MPDPTPGSAEPPRKAAPVSASPSQVWWRRRWFVVGIIVVAGLVMTLASLTLWVRRQALDTERWTEASGQLLRDDQLRHALSVYVVDEAFPPMDATSQVQERLPPVLRPLAGQIAASLRAGAVDVADSVLSRPATQRTWRAINRNAHRTLLTAIDEGRTEVALDVNPIVAEVRAQLGLSPPPPDVGRLVIIDAEQMDQARAYVKTIRRATLFSWILVVVLIAGAIWLADGWRRRAALITGWTAVGVGLLLLVARKIAGTIVVDALAGDSEARDAAAAAWPVATTLLQDVAQALIALGLLVVVGAAALGPTKYAVALRSRVAPVFRRSPAAVYGGFAVIALLALLLLPSAGGRRVIGTIVILALVLGGLEAFRRLTLREFPPPAEPTPAALEDGPAP